MSRILTCAETGVEFEYSGRGRPPKYSVEGRKIKQARDRKATAARKKARAAAIASEVQATA